MKLSHAPQAKSKPHNTEWQYSKSKGAARQHEWPRCLGAQKHYGFPSIWDGRVSLIVARTHDCRHRMLNYKELWHVGRFTIEILKLHIAERYEKSVLGKYSDIRNRSLDAQRVVPIDGLNHAGVRTRRIDRKRMIGC